MSAYGRTTYGPITTGRCESCGGPARRVSPDGTGQLACAACWTPDIRDPRWPGYIGPGTDLSRFEVAPPSRVRAIVR